MGGERVFAIGMAALAIAYGGMIFVAPFLLAGHAQPAVLVAGHVAAAGLLWYWSRQADPHDRAGFTRFYMRVWALFFLEYLLVPIACLAT
jgi:homogentisate phytyltransferase/homogentisate geranylgeranyltransferase